MLWLKALQWLPPHSKKAQSLYPEHRPHRTCQSLSFPHFLSSHGPSFCPSNTLSLFVPKGLCPGCLHCLDHSASNICLAAQVIQASTQTLPPCSFICLLIYCLSCSIPPKHPLECRSHEGRGVAQHVACHTVGISVRWRINALTPAFRAALIVS